MKVLTLNMHKGFSSFRHRQRFVLHELRDAVRDVAADVVFLQEVVGEHRDYSTRYERWPSAPQYEFLAETIWGSVAYGRNAVYQEGHHGNAVLSKIPIIEHRNVDISAQSGEKRGLLHCLLGNPHEDSRLHVICVHLGLSQRHRNQQVGRLCNLIRHDMPAHAPLLVAGDFNDWNLIVHHRLLNDCGLQEALGAGECKPARTFPVFWPLLRLDRIYTRHLMLSKVTVLAQRPWSALSDHAAVVAEVGPRSP